MPLSAFINADQKEESLSHEQVLSAVKGACRLVGNGSSRMSQVRREKIILDVKKSLLFQVKEGDFKDSALNLFGHIYAKESMEYAQKVKAMWSTLSRSEYPPKQ